MKALTLERRNILLHIIEGGLFMGAMVFVDQFTVMIGFVRQLTHNPLIISLIPAALAVGFNAPGLITAQIVQRVRNRHFFVIMTGLFQRLMILLLALFTLALGNFSGSVAGLLSASIFLLFATIGGIGGPAWLDLFLRTIPPGKRSRVVAVRSAIGSATGIIFPILIAFILSNYKFPVNYRILFLISSVFFAFSWIGFCMLKDPDPPPIEETARQKFSTFLKELPKNDANFLAFLFSRVLFSFCLITSSFFTVYFLLQNNHFDDSVIATFAFALNVSRIIGGLAIGYFADKRGNLPIYKLGILLFIPANLLVLLSPSLPVFIAVFMLFGLILTVDMNTYQSFIGEFGNSRNRVYYATLGSSVAGILAGLLPIAAGALLNIGAISYRALFIFCAITAAACFVFVRLKLRAPGYDPPAQ